MRILIVEDDPSLGRQLEDRLTSEGYAVELATDGEEAQFLGETEPYDAVVLDLGLPKRDGLSVLRAWREEGNAVPVLVLTARDHWHDKVQGIDAGADDYLAKPFHLEELLARVRALIRRGKGHASAKFACGDVTLDTRCGSVTVSGRPIELTAYEFRVLAYLMHNIGHVVSRTELTEHVYAQDFDRDSNTIEVFVGRLRRKLGRDIIRTVRGLGYRLEDPAGDQK
jgi:two-component system OmpR family response regulator